MNPCYFNFHLINAYIDISINILSISVCRLCPYKEQSLFVPACDKIMTFAQDMCSSDLSN